MEYAILGMLILIFIQNWSNSSANTTNQQMLANNQTQIMEHQKVLREILIKPTNNE